LNQVVTNNPPVVGNSPVTNSVTSGLTWKIAITNLATQANWSDPDGDTVSLSSVANSFNGVSVTKDSNYVYYNGPVTNEDHFTYFVTDGTLTASGTVYLEPMAATAPSVAPGGIVGGHPTLSGSGIPGYIYGVESKTNLSNPWGNAGTTTVAPNGAWNFTDTNVVNPPTIFYRLYYPYSAGSPPQ
jgi:hypothetical protein